MKSEHQKRVEEFMSKIPGQSVPDQIIVPDCETRRFWARIILKETIETINALGFQLDPVNFKKVRCNLTNKDFIVAPKTGDIKIADVIDGCCDIKVGTTGTLSAFGIEDEIPQLLVDKNNLKKFGLGHYLRGDVKPPGHKPPDIQGWLDRMAIFKSQPISTIRPEICPICDSRNFVGGYGLALGPMGTYTSCVNCETIVAFQKDSDDE